jgi:hypothetical protein
MSIPGGIEDALHIERGGPSYRLMQRIGLIRGDDPSILRRIIAFLAITIVPLCLLAWWEGLLFGPTPRQSLLLDFAAFLRFLVAAPLLFIAELTIGPRVTSAGQQFIRAGIVGPDEYPKFDRAVQRLVRWRDSWLVEVGILAIALIGAWTLTAETVYGAAAKSWNSATIDTENGPRLSLVGLWYRVIAVPLLQFFWYRWIWRYLVWVRFLFDVSRMNLRLVPTHADGSAGLGFLGTAQTSFSILAFGISSVMAASAAFLIVFDGTTINAFRVPFIVLLVVSELLWLGPLLMFSPVMMRARLRGLREYSLLVLEYNRAFHDKWVDGRKDQDEKLLGSADIQSLADLGASFEFIRQMTVVPFSLRVIIQIAVVTLLPALPLLLLIMPVGEIISLVTKAVF